VNRCLQSAVPWGAAVLGAAALHGLGLALRPLPPPRTLQPPAPARLRLLPIVPGSPAAEARALWSPGLFVLPTEHGFGRAREELTLVHPPIEPPAPPPHYLATPRPASPRARPPRPATARRAAGVPAALRPAEPVLPPVATPARHREFDGGWSPAAFTAAPWPERAASAQPWEARVRLAFDEAGVPVHVFVDRATAVDAHVRPEIARTLRAWRLAPDAARHGEVRLRFDPAGLPPPPE
jgi:hypothetical protein